ncbi:YihY/virulence factor BrkB family protein [Halorarius litoreus]|uniref:YihY/virulence factor BrkB family protein n=1 Tax=Halorarius litoreus TaxID=2962676 RepID=UPI0020CCD689|nr:YihY/virulence factor BrkB family protein [Halorarius litoreus]
MSLSTSRARRYGARGKEVVSAIVTEVRAENITFMAGSIAYHAFVSLLPFLLLALFLLTRLGGDELASQVIEALVANITPTAGGANDSARSIAEVLVVAARNATESAGLSVLSAAALVWGTLRIFRGLDQAFSDIYESESQNSFVDQVVDGVIVFGAIGIALFAVTLADAFVGLPSFGLGDIVVRPLLSILSIGIALLPMYYVFPDEDVSVREILPGALVAGTGWTVLSYGFQLYALVSDKSAYGIVGVIILLITWLYFGGLILLLGAAVNAVLSGRTEDVADIAWGESVGTDASHNDAAFVAPLRELDGVFDDVHEVRVESGDTVVLLPPPDEATVRVSTVERPAILGGDRESGELVLKWDSRT